MVKIDQIIRSRRKTIALIVNFDGSLVVRAPHYARDEQIRAFVEEKAAWIRATQAKSRQMQRQAAHEYAEGETFYYLGQAIPLRLVEKGARPLELKDGHFILLASARLQAAALLTTWYKAEAARLLPARAALLAAFFGLKFGKVRISSARRRWGSCSTSGTISLSWRLVMAPAEVMDYVIVHELAHIMEKNHGPEFWARVAAMQPDYKGRLKWLRANGHLLVI